MDNRGQGNADALATLRAVHERVAERAGPSVVGLGPGWERGSGVVVAPGRVLTTARAARGGEVGVTAVDGRRFRGRVAGVDREGGLALIEVEAGGLPPLEVAADPAVAGVGAPVLGVANPGGRGLRVTLGFVASAAGAADERIEHTAPLPRGSAGSALVDPEGRLVGLNVARLGDGFCLAVPASVLASRAETLERGEGAARPRLGLALAPPHVARRLRRAVGLPERDGLLVRAVEEESAAARAGVREGDLIVAAGGRPLSRLPDLLAVLDAHPPAAPLELTLLRGVEERTALVPPA
jgi:S1-C subfamily serine protease